MLLLIQAFRTFTMLLLPDKVRYRTPQVKASNDPGREMSKARIVSSYTSRSVIGEHLFALRVVVLLLVKLRRPDGLSFISQRSHSNMT